MSDPLAIESICAFGMPADDFVRMAAALDVTRIGLAPTRITDNPHNFPDWDLRSDPALLRSTKAALRDEGVSVSQGEGFLIMQGSDIADSQPLIDLMAELGAPTVNSVIIEQDRERAIDQFATFVAMAAERSMGATLEFMPLMWPATLADALAVCDQSNGGRLMLDAMHVYRSGATAEEIANLDPARIAYVQVCDVPMNAGVAMTPEMMQEYGEEARQERLCPGDGDLPLLEFLRLMPRDVTVGIEVPQLSKAKAGIAPVEATRPCVEATRKLLAQID